MRLHLAWILGMLWLAFTGCDTSDNDRIGQDPGPADLTPVITLDLSGINDVVALGNLFVLASRTGVVLVDPAHSTNRVRQVLPILGDGYRLAAKENRVAVSTREYGVNLYRLTVGDTLALQAQITGFDDATELALNGNLLAVADRFIGVQLFRLDDTPTPGLLNQVDVEPVAGQPDEIQGLVLDAQQLAVLYRLRGLVWYDISNPAAAAEQGRRADAGEPLLQHGSWLCYMEQDPDEPTYGLRTHNPLEPDLTTGDGRLDWRTNPYLQDLEPAHACLTGTTLYLDCNNRNRDTYPSACILEFSLHNPAAPRLVARLELPGDWLPRAAATPDYLLLTVTHAPPRLFRR